MYHLIVAHEFGSYAKGQKITDETEVANVLAGHNHSFVVKIAAPVSDAPSAPAPTVVTPITPPQD